MNVQLFNPRHLFLQCVCRQVGTWRVAFCDDIASLAGFGAANTEGLGELLLAFFEHWAWGHDYNR